MLLDGVNVENGNADSGENVTFLPTTQSVEEVYEVFFDKLEEDTDFFAYYGVTEEEAMAVAKERAHSYLKNAIAYLHRQTEFGFVLDLEKKPVEPPTEDDNEEGIEGQGIDSEEGALTECHCNECDSDEQFVEGITSIEVDLITEVMLLRYFERGFAKLKPKINMLSSSDLKLLHSPANERNSYVELIATLKENVVDMISHYEAIDRTTGKHRTISSEMMVVDDMNDFDARHGCGWGWRYNASCSHFGTRWH